MGEVHNRSYLISVIVLLVLLLIYIFTVYSFENPV
jgi:hypothetical protein